MFKESDNSHHPDVMVSSTYTDLTAHREAVCDSLLRLGFFPVGMEYDSAKAGKDVIASSLEMVARAQAYIGIIGHRYGAVPRDAERNPAELSITEIEYQAAVKRGIPVYIFVMGDDHAVVREAVEPVEAYQVKLAALKAEVRLRSISPAFSSVEQLRSLALQSIFELKAQIGGQAEPAPTRFQNRRALAEVTAPHLLATPNFISGHEFVGRRDELTALDEWATGNDSLLVIEAIGGAGKSTLAWQWLNERATNTRPDLAGLLWYSFYEGGADMAAFAANAFTYVTGQRLSNFRGRKTAELAGFLVASLRERPFLLVLDGLERVLVAYHRLDASQTRDDEVASGKDDRACIKPADGDLLRQLVGANPSKILITSRLLPTSLLNKSGQLLPGARHRLLGGLHPDDALMMMRNVGVRGDVKAIKRYLAVNFDNHPQIVGIVGGLVKDYIRDPGNFDRWEEDPLAGAALHLSKLDLVQRQTHILAAALNGLDRGVRQVLSRIAALGSAVGFETVEALNPFLLPQPQSSIWLDSSLKDSTSHLALLQAESRDAPTERLEEINREIDETRTTIAKLEAERATSLEALAEYRRAEEVALPRLISALRDLEQRGLVQWDRQKNTYDLHPVVRGYAFDVLDQPERVDICDLIADHFRRKPADRYSDTKTLADVQQSMSIFRALVQAGRFDQAMRFYRGDFANALSYSIEAHHEILALLKPLFSNGFGRPPVGLRGPFEESYLLNNAAVALIELGRLSEARDALTIKLRLNLEDMDWQNLRICLTNLGETLRDDNRLAQSHAAFKFALELAEVLNNKEDLARGQWYLMATYRITGQFKRARAAYDAFRRLPIPSNRAIYRSGDAEEELCWLDFYEGRVTDDQLDAAEVVARAGSNRTALRSLIRLRGELALDRGSPNVAITAFESAIEMGQAVGLPVASFEARLALAKARFGQWQAAGDICERLVELDRPPHIELAPAYLELGDHDRAREHALAGYSEAWADGPPYSRWRELQQSRAVLKLLFETEPQLPAFDPRAVEPLPYEAEIRQVIADRKKTK
ncbi:MAG: DUF4062 domain-containing protein [Pyrinomonadaceae bacterium]|nr:DUF4062 domain-containing protein [Pyrinomonadaceae bacterium]